ncbi:hypothetical protein AURDEDRAFT_161440 [Auricularia subglabra TFB-10046 SS5]|nr:hypothetical protein AURDEDRAFT_161440 [Auricularia subglabra TFB-10046 SS5]
MRLPPELFIEALSYLGVRDRISASHVCRHWRSMCLCAPSIWSYISSRDVKTSVFGALPVLLDRAQGLPLTLRLAINNRNALDTSRALSLHFSHIKHLVLEMEGLLLPCLRGPLQLAMETPAPLLLSFTLWDDPDTFKTPHGIHWFGGDAPLLSQLKIHRCQPAILRNNHPLVQVKRMMLTPPYTLLQMVDLFPNLTALSIVMAGGSLPNTLPPRTFQRLCALREFVIVIESGDDTILFILHWLSQLTTRHITIYWRRISLLKDPVPQTVSAMIANLSHIESMSLRYSTGLEIDFFDDYGVQRSFLGDPLARHPVPGVFAQIATLSICELVWARGDPLPPAPSVTRLRIFLMQPSSYAANADGDDCASVFLLPRSPPRVHALVCPALQSIEFILQRLEGYEEQLLVAPRHVREFLQSQLVYHAQTLDRLAFSGIVLLQNPVDDVAQLFAMAHDIEIDPRLPPDARPARDLLSWD